LSWLPWRCRAGGGDGKCSGDDLYGETVLPRGIKLPVSSRTGQTVTVKYLDETPTIPIASTDLR
jgi:hypothetical protein